MNKDKVKSAVEEMVNSMFRVQAEKDIQKAIAERMNEEEGMDKAEFKKIAKFAYDLSLDEKKAELEAIEAKMAEIGIE